MEPKHRARNRASATKGTTALRHHQDGKGSSSQPTGYAVHVTPYLCAEKFIKSLTTDVRLGGGFFVCAKAARGPFPNARSACTCGGPAQRCCLLNATETEDPLLIQPMKLPLPRPQRADRNPVVYLAKGEQWRNNRQQSTSEWYLGNDWIAGHRCACARACLGSPRGATSDPMELQHKSTSEWTNEMYGTLVD